MAFAVDTGLRQDNPTLGIKRPKLRGEGFKTWSEADIAQFENRHPVGSRARLALALLLYTGQRRGDVIRMGPQHVNNGAIELRQQKTKTCLAIPIHPALAESMSATPSNDLPFLSLKKASHSLPDISPMVPHGVQKLALPMVCRLTDCGRQRLGVSLRADALRIRLQPMTGHKTLREVSATPRPLPKSQWLGKRCRP